MSYQEIINLIEAQRSHESINDFRLGNNFAVDCLISVVRDHIKEQEFEDEMNRAYDECYE